MNRQILVSLGISTLGTLLVLFYLRNKINDIESKVELMFQLIQDHEKEKRLSNNIQVREVDSEMRDMEEHRSPGLILVSEDSDSEGEEDSSDQEDSSDGEVESNNITLLDTKHNIHLKLDELSNDQADDYHKSANTEISHGDDAVHTNDDGGTNKESDGEESDKEESDKEESDKEESDGEESDGEESDGDEESEEDNDDLEKINYKQYTKNELKSLCEKKGLSRYSKLNKGQLVELLTSK
jgi:hypothetical protein